MGPGFAQLTDLAISQLSRGFDRYVLEDLGSRGDNKILLIVLGFDGCHNSSRFAQLASNVFIKNKIRVMWFSECVPTPVVSFATVALNCDAGLMITASDNPKLYNGYKVDLNDGAQILSLHDVRTCQMDIGQPRDEYWNFTNLISRTLFSSANSILEVNFSNESFGCCFYRECKGFKNDVSLNGFKLIGNFAHELCSKGKLVILAKMN